MGEGGVRRRQATVLRRALRARRFLRPAKWRNIVRRRWFEYRLPRAVTLTPEPAIEHLGSSYGGWFMPTQRIARGAVVYSVGIGGDASFDEAMIDRFGCEVWAFDPTDAARDHVRGLGRDRLHFRQVALWAADTTVRMFVAEDPRSASVSGANLHRTRRWTAMPGRGLASLMREHGHARVDVLKVDVEGAEYEVVDPAVVAASGAEVFAIELHHTASARRARAFIDALARHGYRPVARKLTSFTFVREVP